MAIDRSWLRTAQISNTDKRVWDLFLDLYDTYTTTVSAAELLVLDNALAGVVVASKAVIYDSAGKIYQASASPAALGTTVADATPLTAMVNYVTGADGTKGVLLPIAAADEVVFVANADTANVLKVYAITGSQVNALGSTVAFSVQPGVTQMFIGRSATLWNTGAVSNSIAGLTATAAELNKNAGVTGGAVIASKTMVTDANSAVDNLRATTSRTLGGTGVPGAANVVYEMTKEVTAIADNTATAILTITVPNAAHAATVEVDVLGRLGAGGAIGADEGVSSSKYIISVARTAGVASVAVVGAQLGVAQASVVGGATVTAVVTQTATGEGVGVTNTHVVKITIARGSGTSANHKCDVRARLQNANASGVTIA